MREGGTEGRTDGGRDGGREAGREKVRKRIRNGIPERLMMNASKVPGRLTPSGVGGGVYYGGGDGLFISNDGDHEFASSCSQPRGHVKKER